MNSANNHMPLDNPSQRLQRWANFVIAEKTALNEYSTANLLAQQQSHPLDVVYSIFLQERTKFLHIFMTSSYKTKQ